MLLAIVLGAVFAFAGFLPLAAALRLSRKHPSTGIASTAGYALGGVFLSFVVLGIGVFICSRVAHDHVLVSGLVEIFLFIVISVAYFLWHNKLIRHTQDGGKGE